MHMVIVRANLVKGSAELSRNILNEISAVSNSSMEVSTLTPLLTDQKESLSAQLTSAILCNIDLGSY